MVSPYAIAGAGAIAAAIFFSVGPPAPVPLSADHDAFVLARKLYEHEMAALTYGELNGGAAGVVTPAMLGSLLPAGDVLPGGVTMTSCIGTVAEKRAVATWVSSATYPFPPRIGVALANLPVVKTGNIGAAGLVQASGLVVPGKVTPVYTFPASCGLGATPFPAVVVPLLP